jgi:hypothetical protein
MPFATAWRSLSRSAISRAKSTPGRGIIWRSDEKPAGIEEALCFALAADIRDHAVCEIDIDGGVFETPIDQRPSSLDANIHDFNSDNYIS